MRKLLTVLITAALSLSILPAYSHVSAEITAVSDKSRESITLTVNGEKKDISPKILNKEGVIYIPVVGVSKFLFGSFADYSNSLNKIITVNRYSTIFTNKINTDILSVNGGEIKIAGSSFKKSGDYYVTEDFLKTVFGVNCRYNEKTNTVIIWQTDETDIKKLPQEIQGLDKVMWLKHYQPQYLERYVAYKKAHKELDYYDVVTYINIGLDFPYYSNVNEVNNANDPLVLCNKYNYLPENYVPEGYEKSDGRVLTLRKEAQEQFEKMKTEAEKSDVYIYIVSGYRSYTVQNQIYNNYKRGDPNGADTYSARAGYSEHQTGLAADLNSASSSSNFENTKEYSWLFENAHKYGFILRYPKDKEWITGYIFEPWHWRYVGAETAEKINELGITFDEYYAIYLVPQNIKF